MFTGIIQEIGEVIARREEGDLHFRIACRRPAEEIAIGASIACSGVCLTVTETGREAGRSWFEVAVSAATLACTTAGEWRPGTRLNLEPALRVGDELGGHIVTGHVDGVGEVLAIVPEGQSHRVRIRAPSALARFIAPKGSIAVDGISLTVNAVEGSEFTLNIIPHTWRATTMSGVAPGSRVNLEIDVLARYVARLKEMGD